MFCELSRKFLLPIHNLTSRHTIRSLQALQRIHKHQMALYFLVAFIAVTKAVIQYYVTRYVGVVCQIRLDFFGPAG